MSLLSKHNPVKTIIKHSGSWIPDFNDFTAFFGYFGWFNDTSSLENFITLIFFFQLFFAPSEKRHFQAVLTTNIFFNDSVWNANIRFEGIFWFRNLLEVFLGLKENSRSCILNNSFLIGNSLPLIGKES